MGWIVAGIAALIGGISNLISQNSQTGKDIETAQDSIDQLTDEKQDALDLMDLQFENAKEEANKNADRSDAQTTLEEGYVAADVNNQLNGLSLQQEIDTWNFNTAAQNAGAQEGQALAQMAASGVKNSTMNTAVELEAAQNAAQLQLQEDQTRASEKLSLNSILGNLASNVNTMQFNRTDANDLRASYEEGGYQYELYNKQRSITEKKYNNAIQQYTDAKTDLEDSRGWKNFISLFTGASSGLAAGYNVGSIWSDSLSYNTSTNKKDVTTSSSSTLSFTPVTPVINSLF